MLARHTMPFPRSVRSISLFDNVRKILSRSAPASPLPTENEVDSSKGAGPVQNTGPVTKVGTMPRSKVVGFDFGNTPRLSGAQLSTTLQSALDQALAGNTEISEARKLRVARTITKMTGRRVPDFVLNSVKTKQEILDYFANEELKGSGAYQKLQFDKSRLPGNVRITQ